MHLNTCALRFSTHLISCAQALISEQQFHFHWQAQSQSERCHVNHKKVLSTQIYFAAQTAGLEQKNIHARTHIITEISLSVLLSLSAFLARLGSLSPCWLCWALSHPPTPSNGLSGSSSTRTAPKWRYIPISVISEQQNLSK
jgi:hypothetical protein